MKALTENQKRLVIFLHDGIYGPEHNMGTMTQDQMDRLIGCADYIARLSISRGRWRFFALFALASFLMLLFARL